MIIDLNIYELRILIALMKEEISKCDDKFFVSELEFILWKLGEVEEIKNR